MQSEVPIQGEGEPEPSDREAEIFNLRSLVAKQPDNARAQFRLGCLLSESDSEGALRSLRKALSLAMLEDNRDAEELRRLATQGLLEIMRELECQS